jgi:hypothetical protein
MNREKCVTVYKSRILALLHEGSRSGRRMRKGFFMKTDAQIRDHPVLLTMVLAVFPTIQGSSTGAQSAWHECIP